MTSRRDPISEVVKFLDSFSGIRLEKEILLWELSYGIGHIVVNKLSNQQRS